jgi:bifunctional non-homologous end joining protein LigD
MVKLTHLDKIFWKPEKITKGDLLNYYTTIAPFILPYLKNRPVVLHRFPNGIDGEDFYQKESGPKLPPFIKTISIQHENKKISYFVVQNTATLLYIANLGSIELHPFHARKKNLDKPDYVVFDLDPQGVSFDTVVDIALLLHELFEENKIPSFCKTSGGRGLHVYVPLNGKYDYEVVKKFAALIAALIHEKAPKITSLERSPNKRKKKIYIDILQNQKMQTIVCPYSVRGFPHAPVSTPLKWSEVKHGLDPLDFNLRTVPKRVSQKGDCFRSILKTGIPLEKALKRMEKSHA